MTNDEIKKIINSGSTSKFEEFKNTYGLNTLNQLQNRYGTIDWSTHKHILETAKYFQSFFNE